MCENETMKTELNQELSEREDLIAQLDEQDRIMKMMKEQLEKYKREKDDYTQVVFQLQRQGKYLNEGMFSGNSTKIHYYVGYVRYSI